MPAWEAAQRIQPWIESRPQSVVAEGEPANVAESHSSVSSTA
jgi:hypothetical protein